jgi:hypothetical protein
MTKPTCTYESTDYHATYNGKCYSIGTRDYVNGTGKELYVAIHDAALPGNCEFLYQERGTHIRIIHRRSDAMRTLAHILDNLDALLVALKEKEEV